MRKKLAFLALMIVLGAPAAYGEWDFSNPCRTFYCQYDGPDLVSCASSSTGMGRWVDCETKSSCGWYSDGGGWSVTCQYDCEGEYCLEV